MTTFADKMRRRFWRKEAYSLGGYETGQNNSYANYASSDTKDSIRLSRISQSRDTIEMSELGQQNLGCETSSIAYSSHCGSVFEEQTATLDISDSAGTINNGEKDTVKPAPKLFKSESLFDRGRRRITMKFKGRGLDENEKSSSKTGSLMIGGRSSDLQVTLPGMQGAFDNLEFIDDDVSLEFDPEVCKKMRLGKGYKLKGTVVRVLF